jgi:hypothetical protein
MSEALIDQGHTRLETIGFLRGSHAGIWNGASQDNAWIRYRAHQIDRDATPDGHVITLGYVDFDESAVNAVFTVTAGHDEDALVTLRMIDQIIDAAIAHHGEDGVS